MLAQIFPSEERLEIGPVKTLTLLLWVSKIK